VQPVLACWFFDLDQSAAVAIRSQFSHDARVRRKPAYVAVPDSTFLRTMTATNRY